MLEGVKPVVRIGTTEIQLPRPGKEERAGAVFGKKAGKWALLGKLDSVDLPVKRPTLQGPIDDAFVAPFLCVRGTGKAWNPKVQAWADAGFARFAHEWRRYFRGDLPIKNDTDVTKADIKKCNLILFGDPGSNRWIGKVLPQLPIQWTHDVLRIEK